MKEVIFCNTLDGLQAAVQGVDDKVITYLVFTCDAYSGEIVNFAGAHPQRFRAAGESTVPNLGKNFQEKFVDFMARVNRDNKSCLWWALNFTNKNPISTRLCDRTSQLLQIVDMVESGSGGGFLVVCNDPVLVKQFRLYARGKSIQITDIISRRRNIREITKRICPAAIYAAFCRAVGRSILARFFCRPRLRGAQRQTVVLSLLKEKCFAQDGRYRDTYFGDLLDHLYERCEAVTSLLICTGSSYRTVLKKACIAIGRSNVAMVEGLLHVRALLACLFQALWKYFVPVTLRGSTAIAGVDVGYLVKTAIKDEYRSGRFFDNLRVYYAVRALAATAQIDRFYHPFENQSYEKMAILALRDVSPMTRIVGYQHASLSQRHTNFLLGAGESDILPLPDAIMTMGKVTREVMIDPGGFPADLLHIGCALRQKPHDGPLKSQTPVTNLFVALATNIEEYVKVLRFLDEALGTDSPYQVWIRPHPEFSLEEAISIAGHPRFEYHKAERETLAQCMDWAHVVLYVHSTVAIESVARGTPAVYLNVPNVLNPDPMLTFTDFKWQVSQPAELIAAIEEINSLSPDEYQRKQKLGVRFAQDYFVPATEESLDLFLTV